MLNNSYQNVHEISICMYFFGSCFTLFDRVSSTAEVGHPFLLATTIFQTGQYSHRTSIVGCSDFECCFYRKTENADAEMYAKLKSETDF